ncbi:MAG: hypothetical protein RLZZ111_1221 [Planctomycetota bacterium]|jgi:hypothetical protein
MIISTRQTSTPGAGPDPNAVGAAAALPADAVVEPITLPHGAPIELACILLPADDLDTAAYDAAVADAVDRCTTWIGEQAAADAPLQVPLYGTHVIWHPRRAAAIAPADRVASLRTALTDFARLEAELRGVEAGLADSLDRVEGDAAVVYGVDEHSFARRRELTERYRSAIALRRRLAVVAPAVARPAPQPPTLAGQVGERLRDRTRLAERLEHAVEQADLVERVYAACGDRIGDFAISRRHSALEWVIILLLAAELVLLCVDLLAGRTS